MIRRLTRSRNTDPGRVSFFFFHSSTFQLVDKPWSQVSPLLTFGSCLQFSSRIGILYEYALGTRNAKLTYTRLEDSQVRRRGNRRFLCTYERARSTLTSAQPLPDFLYGINPVNVSQPFLYCFFLLNNTWCDKIKCPVLNYCIRLHPLVEVVLAL